MQAYKTSRGHWQVNFSEFGKQRTLYLGSGFTSGSADRIAKIVTDILSCRKRGEVLPLEVVRRIELLPDRVRSSFERLGLIGGVSRWTLTTLLESFYEMKSDLSAGTRYGYNLCGTSLIEFFDKDRRIDSIEKSDCERFKNHYLVKYSACTLARVLRRCRSIFKFAVDTGRLVKNPFEKVSGNAEVNLSRQVYVARDMIFRVMACCRDDYDRLILALARFGGLRIPSEIRHLRYCDFTDTVIRIHEDTKTGAREVPLFGEIREIFEHLTQAGLSKENPADSSWRIFANVGDFRTRISTAIRASGVERWVKLFVNLRSSCITDMVERRYSEKMLDSMFGNSTVVRQRHYVQFRKDKEYAKALEENERLLTLLHEGVDESDVPLQAMDDLLLLRDILVRRFGTGNKAG
jgi:site-specific recombinase XerD